jgi:DNA repair protein RecN (Recombination protein N)
MLTCLRVRHLAIIDRLEIDLGEGLNVVTGETGAGKSILVAALQLVLGARARADMVRTGCEQAEVEALFELPATPAMGPVRQVLEAEGLPLDEDDQLVLRRIVKANGRSRASVNGRLATLAQLRRIARGLVDISSQHEHTTLVEAGTHLGYLDAFGEHGAALEAVGRAFGAAREASRALASLEEALRDRGEREERLRFQLAEVERVQPEAGELARLTTERDRLRHGERLVAAAGRTAQVLDADEGGGVCDRLTAVEGELAAAARLDPALEPLAERLTGARTELRELAYDLAAYARDLDLEPGRLEAVEDRLAALRRVLRRFGGDEEALAAFVEEAREELSGLDDLEERVDAARRTLEQALAGAAASARDLSVRRRAVAEALAGAITAELADLGMGRARVQVEVAPREEAADGLAVDGAGLTATGIDRAEFLIAPNPGEPPRPLARVASGGELSRALLALKRVLAGTGPVGLYVFDEVDTGVGGAIAEAIGRKIREVAQHHQVLCITHQPQIAAFGDIHLHVEKAVEEDGRTRSRVARLDPADRRRELARMLGGATLTDATHQAAADLLRLAHEEAP